VFRLDLDDDFLAEPEHRRIQTVKNWCATNLSGPLSEWPQDRMCFFGEDFGRVSDRTVIAPGYLTQKLVRRFPWAVELCNVPFEQQRQVLFYVVDRLPRSKLIGGALDSTGNGAYLAEQAALRYGLSRIQQVNITDKWYAENLPPFRAGFEDRLIEVVRDADHLIDLTHFRVINGVPKLPRLKNPTASGEGPPRHGDAGIAYVLGHVASRAHLGEYAYEPGKPSRSKRDSVGPTRQQPKAYTSRGRTGGML
jgi:phage FluMu gp28-like protein